MTVPVDKRELCAGAVWEGLPGTPTYRPVCHWTALCQAQGCFWQWPAGGLSRQQRGLDL